MHKIIIHDGGVHLIYTVVHALTTYALKQGVCLTWSTNSTVFFQKREGKNEREELCLQNISYLSFFLLAAKFVKAPCAAPAVNPTIHNSAAL